MAYYSSFGNLTEIDLPKRLLEMLAKLQFKETFFSPITCACLSRMSAGKSVSYRLDT